MQTWKCLVCGFEYEGKKPPKECPSCGSSQGEFVKAGWKKKDLDKKYDLLIINGSMHRAHNTAALAGIAEKVARNEKVSYRTVNLNEFKIEHCWCCYSMRETYCTFPCRNQLDEAHFLHNMILAAKAVIVASPINWNSMNAQMKDFLDRLTCIQNLALVEKKAPCAGKTLGILVAGHEDGAYKTALDIFLVFQQMGFVLAPFGIAYITHGRSYKSETDSAFILKDRIIKEHVAAVAENTIKMMRLNMPAKLGRVNISSS